MGESGKPRDRKRLRSADTFHLREVAQHVQRGVWEAGGLPLAFPVMSLGETQMRPTAMLFRNLLAMDDVWKFSEAVRAGSMSLKDFMARRLAQRPALAKPKRGYAKMYVEHVLQADQGCDFDFLVGASGADVTRESH
jgi:dihydroxyacid dehydratase/phosphogluconate dehydratase